MNRHKLIKIWNDGLGSLLLLVFMGSISWLFTVIIYYDPMLFNTELGIFSELGVFGYYLAFNIIYGMSFAGYVIGIEIIVKYAKKRYMNYLNKKELDVE